MASRPSSQSEYLQTAINAWGADFRICSYCVRSTDGLIACGEKTAKGAFLGTLVPSDVGGFCCTRHFRHREFNGYMKRVRKVVSRDIRLFGY